MFSMLSPGNMKFVENLEERFEEFTNELPGDFKRQDKAEGTTNAAEFS